MIILFSLNEPSSQLMTSWKEDPYSLLFFLKFGRDVGELISYSLNP